MGKVYLGDEHIGDMYTRNIVEYNEVIIIEILKKPPSRYWVDDNGVAEMIEANITDWFHDALTIENYGLYYTFSACAGLTGTVSFPALTSVRRYGLCNTFANCIGLTGSVSFPELTSIGSSGFDSAFYYCTGLTGSVSFPKLTSVGDYGLMRVFYGCTGLTGSISFPELTSAGYLGFSYAFRGCTGITEIHFRADAKATIEAQSDYSSKFGATNATIYFDL